MAISNLTDTTWLLNETLSGLTTNWSYDVNIIAGNLVNNYNRIYASGGDLYLRETNGSANLIYNGSWVGDYRQIEIIGGTDVSNSALISWLNSNAKQVLVISEVIDQLRMDLDYAYTIINAKGGTLPTNKNTDSLGRAISSIPSRKTEETKTVDLDMASGNQVVSSTGAKVMTQVTITKPSTLVPENIKKDINIGGVVGTLESGGSADENAIYTELLSATYPVASGETWVFNDCIYGTVYTSKFYYVDFQCVVDGSVQTFTSIRRGPGDGSQPEMVEVFYDALLVYSDAGGCMWRVDEQHKTITITGGEDFNNTEFRSWLESNATMQ